MSRVGMARYAAIHVVARCRFCQLHGATGGWILDYENRMNEQTSSLRFGSGSIIQREDQGTFESSCRAIPLSVRKVRERARNKKIMSTMLSPFGFLRRTLGPVVVLPVDQHVHLEERMHVHMIQQDKTTRDMI